MGPEVQILSGTPANNAESLCFPGLSAFFIGKHENAPYCYGASVCQKASALLYRECRGEHCSPAAIAVTLDSTGAYGMLPYGVGADSISARAIWGNAKPHGRTLCAPTRHFLDRLRQCVKKHRLCSIETVGANIVRLQQLAVTLDSPGAYGMLPYGVGADSISARGVGR